MIWRSGIRFSEKIMLEQNAAKESGLKRIALAVALIAAVSVQQSFARDGRADRPAAGAVKSERTKSAGIKSVAPGNSPRHRAPGGPALKPASRNAIGIRADRPAPVPADAGEHVRVVPPSLPLAGPAAATSLAKPAGGPARAIGGPIGGLQNVRPTANAGIAGRGRIDGVHLIRPALAPAPLGGPARAVVGINGTALRPKH